MFSYLCLKIIINTIIVINYRYLSSDRYIIIELLSDIEKAIFSPTCLSLLPGRIPELFTDNFLHLLPLLYVGLQFTQLTLQLIHATLDYRLAFMGRTSHKVVVSKESKNLICVLKFASKKSHFTNGHLLRIKLI